MVKRTVITALLVGAAFLPAAAEPAAPTNPFYGSITPYVKVGDEEGVAGGAGINLNPRFAVGLDAAAEAILRCEDPPPGVKVTLSRCFPLVAALRWRTTAGAFAPALFARAGYRFARHTYEYGGNGNAWSIEKPAGGIVAGAGVGIEAPGGPFGFTLRAAYAFNVRPFYKFIAFPGHPAGEGTLAASPVTRKDNSVQLEAGITF